MYNVSAVYFGAAKHIKAQWGHEVQCALSVNMTDFIYVIYVFPKCISLSMQAEEKQIYGTHAYTQPSICEQSTLVYR